MALRKAPASTKMEYLVTTIDLYDQESIDSLSGKICAGLYVNVLSILFLNLNRRAKLCAMHYRFVKLTEPRSAHDIFYCDNGYDILSLASG